jgi:hypothetical protein
VNFLSKKYKNLSNFKKKTSYITVVCLTDDLEKSLKSTGMIVVHDIDIHHENGAPSMCDAHPLINATRRTHVFLEKIMCKKL